MKKILFLFAIVSLALTIGSCKKEIDLTLDVEQPTSGVAIISASVGVDTRVEFEEQLDKSVKLTWSAGDIFTLYEKDTDKWAANFKLKSGGEGNNKADFEIITADGGGVLEGAKYHIVYPALYNGTVADKCNYIDYVNTIENRIQKGNGDDLTHLSGMCYMEYKDFEYQPTGNIMFEHKYALLTAKLGTPSDWTPGDVPKELTIFNGSRSYNLKLENVNMNNGLTVYIMIDPCAAEARDFVCNVLTTNKVVFEKRVSVNKEYKAGKRYTADFSAVNSFTALANYTIDNLPATLTPNTTYVITDAITSSINVPESFTKKFQTEGANISVILPNATELKDYNGPSNNYMFRNCKGLKSITLPVATSIGNSVFSGCNSLISVSLPVATLIGDATFSGCSSLNSVTLPEVTSIGQSSFSGCSSLNSISLPLVKAVPDRAFTTCSSLSEISLPAATSIGATAFSSCTSLINISLPMVTSIGNSAFNNCISLVSVSLPKARIIGNMVFYKCSLLSSITLTDVETIESRAFSSCSRLAVVTMPIAKTIKDNAFDSCTSLTEIYLPAAKDIGVDAFYYCYKVTTITLPMAEIVASSAFRACNGLKTLELGTNNNAQLKSVATDIFGYNPKLTGVTLKLSKTEHTANVNVTDKKWRDYGPFAAIESVNP